MKPTMRQVAVGLVALAFLVQSWLLVWLLGARAEYETQMDQGKLDAIRQGHQRLEAKFVKTCAMNGNSLITALGTAITRLDATTTQLEQCTEAAKSLTDNATKFVALENEVRKSSEAQQAHAVDLKSHIDGAVAALARQESLARLLTAFVCQADAGCFDGLVQLAPAVATLRELHNPSKDTPLLKAMSAQVDTATEALKTATEKLQNTVDTTALVRKELQVLNEGETKPVARLAGNTLVVQFAAPALLACEDVEVAVGVLSEKGGAPSYAVTLNSQLAQAEGGAVADLQEVSGIALRRSATQSADTCVVTYELGSNGGDWFGKKKALGRSLWVQFVLVARGAHRVVPIN